MIENKTSICGLDGDYFVVTDKATGKESFRVSVKEKPEYALSLLAKWGYTLMDGVTEEDLIPDLNKSRGMPVGTVREWKGKKFIKTATGWKPHNEGGYKPSTGKADDSSMQDLLAGRGGSKAIGDESGKYVADGVSVLKSSNGSTRFLYNKGVS